MPRIVGVAKSGKSVGEIIKLGFTSLPFGYLACDGSSQLRSAYPDLFTAIGTTYGSVDGTHFNLPDLKGRSAMGDGAGAGLTTRTVGQAVGGETHTLATGNLPPHSHAASGLTVSGTNVSSTVSGNAIAGVNLDHTHTTNVPVDPTEQWSPSKFNDGNTGWNIKGRNNTDVITTGGSSSTLDHSHGLSATAAAQSWSGGVSGSTGNGPGTTTTITHSSPATVVKFAIAYQ